jgi:hypothetical protein
MEERRGTSTDNKRTAFSGRDLLARIIRMEFWSVEFPALLDAWGPQFANSFADDAWLAPWRKVATVGPLVAATIGFLAPWFWPGMVHIYTESLAFLMLAGASAALNWALGAGLLFGYILGDALHVLVTSFLSARILAGHVVGYLLLGILVVRIPQLAWKLARGVRLHVSDARLRLAATAGLNSVICAGLVLLWCQGTIVLIRPVFTWPGGEPTDQAVVPVQVHWPWIVAASAIATIARVILQDFSISRSPVAHRIGELRELRRTSSAQQAAAWRGLTMKTRVMLRAIFLTVILAGTYAGWIDPIIVLIVSGAIGLWGNGFLGKVPQGWIELTAKIPPMLRVAIIPIIGFLISDVIVTLSWNTTESLRPVMLGSLFTVTLFYAMFPKTPSATGLSHGAPGDVHAGTLGTAEKL